MKEYFVGTDRHNNAWKRNVMISANSLVRNEGGRLRQRKYPLSVSRWMMDSGAFSQITTYGDFIMSPEEYVLVAKYFELCGDLQCIVTQDYMCEPDVIRQLQDKGIRASVRIHQRKTVERYMQILKAADKYDLRVPVMPVLQGWEVEDYKEHMQMYDTALLTRFETKYERKFGSLIRDGDVWLGIGSTCKRNKNPEVVAEILDTLEWNFRMNKPKIHLFGFKQTGLKNSRIKDRIYSADSFAYDFSDRMDGLPRKSKNRIESAIRFHDKVVHNDVQLQLV
jgi:hypothetical protein